MASVVYGASEPALYEGTLGQLLEEQSRENGTRIAVTFSWQQHHLSYLALRERSELLAKSMLNAGLRHGDCIGIMAGNCYQYIEVFLGAARIGCPLVVLNNTYSVSELCSALQVSSVKLLFITDKIGFKSLSSHVQAVCTGPAALTLLKTVVQIAPQKLDFTPDVEVLSYSAFVNNAYSVFVKDAALRSAERKVRANDVLNLQFTSGTTGAPKAAMLTHRNLINNGRLFGTGLNLTEDEVVCCPAPLFHCFGLVLGFLAAFSHSSRIVYPCDQFDPKQTLDAVAKEQCTMLLGVPTMFVAELEALGARAYDLKSLKRGLAAGSPVPAVLMKILRQRMGIEKMQIAYGMTETSPVSFMTPLTDNDELRSTTVGRILPHTAAKVINHHGDIVPRGTPGELCVSGYLLQKGYWQNDAKTAEAMKVDEDGVRWMYTGDECVITQEGYCRVTGRIKDLIIRGGENISPVQVEERLLEHEAVAEACVVGIKDDKYGEVVGCFLRQADKKIRPSSAELSDWTRQQLGSHKAPQHVFWLGDPGVVSDFPKTGSGKHQKHILRALGNQLAQNSTRVLKL